MNHRERVAQLTSEGSACLDLMAEREGSYRALAANLLKQMAWARDKMERGALLCKDSWDRAHLRTVVQALALDHPLLLKDKELIMELTNHVSTDAATRKALPICKGVLDYFPDALLAVAAVSKTGNDQHNPGQPLHWAKEKSTDESDALLRHLIDRGKLDTDGQRHSAKVAWRALALLQREIDAEQVTGEIEPPVTAAKKKKDNQHKAPPGKGYRLLGRGEVLKNGDEFFTESSANPRWVHTMEPGKQVGIDSVCDCTYRRKIEAPITVRQVRRAPSDTYRYMENGEILRKGSDEINFGAYWMPVDGSEGLPVADHFKARRKLKVSTNVK